RRHAAPAPALCAHPRRRGRHVDTDAYGAVGAHVGAVAGQVRPGVRRGPAAAPRPTATLHAGGRDDHVAPRKHLLVMGSVLAAVSSSVMAASAATQRLSADSLIGGPPASLRPTTRTARTGACARRCRSPGRAPKTPTAPGAGLPANIMSPYSVRLNRNVLPRMRCMERVPISSAISRVVRR